MALLAGKGVCGEQMALTLAVWVCTLPGVFLIVASLWGLEVAALASLIVLAALTLMCAGVCSWKVYGSGETSLNRKERT